MQGGRLVQEDRNTAGGGQKHRKGVGVTAQSRRTLWYSDRVLLRPQLCLDHSLCIPSLLQLTGMWGSKWGQGAAERWQGEVGGKSGVEHRLIFSLLTSY